MDSGEERMIEVEALGQSGFLLNTAEYGSGKGHSHGSWSGPMHLDGVYIVDRRGDEHLYVMGQLRDTPIRVRKEDPVGYGMMESLMSGAWPELRLTTDSGQKVAQA
jgi:hypothetical protein